METQKLCKSTIRNLVVKKYCLQRLKYDFMGYPFQSLKDLEYHHVIIPSCECNKWRLGDGYYIWNGVALNGHTSHRYLHTIGFFDLDRFEAISSELKDMIFKGYISFENLREIDAILTSFEKEYLGKYYNKRLIVQSEYTERMFRNKKSYF